MGNAYVFFNKATKQIALITTMFDDNTAALDGYDESLGWVLIATNESATEEIVDLEEYGL